MLLKLPRVATLF